VEEVKQRITVAKESVPKESSSAAVAEQQAVAVAQADRQRMLAETALLRAEVRRAEAGTIHAIGALKDAQGDLKALQASVRRQLEEVKGRINDTETRRLRLAETIGNTSGVREENIQRRRGFELQLRRLRRRLSPIAYDALKAENEAYQVEVRQASALVQESKLAEAQAASQAQQLKAQVAAQQQASAVAVKTAQDAQQEGQSRLASAVTAASEDLRKAQEQQADAEKKLAANCDSAWQERTAAHQAKLETCRQLEEELITAKAQREVLQQTLQAETTANSADDS